MVASIACQTRERQIVNRVSSKPAQSKRDGNAVWLFPFHVPLSARSDELLITVDNLKLEQTVARACVSLAGQPTHTQRRLKLDCGGAGTIYVYLTLHVRRVQTSPSYNPPRTDC